MFIFYIQYINILLNCHTALQHSTEYTADTPNIVF